MTSTEMVARIIAEHHYNRKLFQGACTKQERTQWLVNTYWSQFIAAADAVIHAHTGNTVMSFDYSAALIQMKAGRKMRRLAWKSDKWVYVRFYAQSTRQLSNLEIHTTEGNAAYTPSRCDQFVDDWVGADPEAYMIEE
jgi:hypothetical protein